MTAGLWIERIWGRSFSFVADIELGMVQTAKSLEAIIWAAALELPTTMPGRPVQEVLLRRPIEHMHIMSFY